MTKMRNGLENGLILGLSQTLQKASYSIVLLLKIIVTLITTVSALPSATNPRLQHRRYYALRFKLVSMSASIVKDRVAYRKEPAYWLLFIDINEYCTKRHRAFNDLI